MFPGGMHSPTPRPHASASLTSSRAPTAPRHFCILEAKAAAEEPRSSLATAKKSATLSCSGMVRGAPGAPGGGRGSGERLPCGAPGCRLSPAQRPAPRTGSAAPGAPHRTGRRSEPPSTAPAPSPSRGGPARPHVKGEEPHWSPRATAVTPIPGRSGCPVPPCCGGTKRKPCGAGGSAPPALPWQPPFPGTSTPLTPITPIPRHPAAT